MTMCDGCRYNKRGRCRDRTGYGSGSRELLTDDRVCQGFEVKRSLPEGFRLFLLGLVRKQGE